MGEVHYMISEAAKRVDVEAHVLRYWEEELEIPIERTAMGHRYYTEENIRLFQCIKELKTQGLMLKELKEILPEILKAKQELQEREKRPENTNKNVKQENSVDARGEVLVGVLDEHAEQIQQLFGKVVRDAMNENNEILEEVLSRAVSEKVMKEMDYLMQTKERQEEERFQKLDHLIRQQQSMRKEASKPAAVRRLRRVFGTV